jgi:hypothetical protein
MTCEFRKALEPLSGDGRYEVELAPGSDMVPSCLKHTLGPKVAESPVIGASSLTLELMRLDRGTAAQRKLGTFANLTQLFNGHRFGATSKHLKELSSGPGTFIVIADLVGLTTGSRTHLSVSL